MHKKLGLQLLCYSLSLIGFSYAFFYLAPAIGRPSLYAGMAGGPLCLIWSLLALGGKRTKAPAILTLIPIIMVFIGQAIAAWLGGEEIGTGRQAAALVATVATVFSLAMLMLITTAGLNQITPPGQSQSK